MYVFIVNISAGNGKALTAWRKIESILIQENIQYKMINSSSEIVAHAFIADQIHLHKVKAIGILGGDGTTSSVIQQLANTSIPIAIFPAGSGNDTTRMFGLTDNPVHFIKTMLDGRATTIDLLKLNDRYGITVAGVGIDSAIGHRVNQAFYKPFLNKVGLGSLAYIIATVFSAMTFQSFNGKITIDGDPQKLNNTWLIACGNTTSYGGGLTICPQALASDGLLNITMFHELKRIKAILRIFPTLLRGKPILKPGITYKEGKAIIITTDRLIPAIVDGEIITSTRFEITIHRNALQLILTI